MDDSINSTLAADTGSTVPRLHGAREPIGERLRVTAPLLRNVVLRATSLNHGAERVMLWEYLDRGAGGFRIARRDGATA